MVIFCGHYPKQSREAYKGKYPEGMHTDDGFFGFIYTPHFSIQ